MSFASFARQYLKDKKDELKPATYRNKEYCINAHLMPYFGLKKMCDIKPSDLLEWQRVMREKGLKESSLRYVQIQLKVIFVHAETIYGLSDNPCRRIKNMGSSSSGSLSFWTHEQFRQFITEVPSGSRDHVIFMLLFYSGMRIGELLALTGEDVDMDENAISVSKTYHRIDKKDYITTPKTVNSKRTVCMPERVMKELEKYIGSLGKKYRSRQRIFSVTSKTIRNAFIKYTEAAGLPHIRIHDLRHSHASYLINLGVKPMVIKERLGHGNIQVTLNVYGHLYPNEQKKAVDLMELIE